MAQADIQAYEGTFSVDAEARFAIVAGRFNAFIVERLVEGAIDALRRHGVSSDRIVVARTPGSFEIPVLCKRFAQSGKCSAVIALGAVIRGATPHFDHVASEVSSGCGKVALETGVPIIFGVLTTDTIEQAVERAGTKAGNKGWDAGLAALEMVSLGRAMASAGY